MHHICSSSSNTIKIVQDQLHGMFPYNHNMFCCRNTHHTPQGVNDCKPIPPTAVGDLPHQMQLINAGDDGLCGTSDDGDIRSIPADLPTQYVRNGTVP